MRERCLGLWSYALSHTFCDLLHVFDIFTESKNYVGRKKKVSMTVDACQAQQALLLREIC